jgi:CheY-like chemotaxis protein
MTSAPPHATSEETTTRAADRILVVEDDDGFRETMSELLREEGYAVEDVGDGLEALRILAQPPLPKLILLDLMLTNVDGFEFRRTQLADPELAKIPVLVLSGASDIAAISAALRVAGHIRKPFDAQTLLSAVEQQMGPPRAPAP